MTPIAPKFSPPALDDRLLAGRLRLHANLAPVTAWEAAEVAAGLVLLVTGTAVIVRPAYRSSRVLLGMAVASCAVGLLGVLLGLR